MPPTSFNLKSASFILHPCFRFSEHPAEWGQLRYPTPLGRSRKTTIHLQETRIPGSLLIDYESMADKATMISFCSLPMMPYAIYLLDATVIFLVVYLHTKFKSTLPAALPPGPPAEPLIGHLRVIPPTHQEQTFQQWGKEYGDVIYLSIPGRSIVVLNSLRTATDLLEKRSSIYSDRPDFPTFELLGWTRALLFLRYNDKFRKHRKLLQVLSKERCPAFQAIQTREAHILLQNLMERPENFEQLVRRYTVAVIMDVTYGWKVTSDDDEFIRLLDDHTRAIESLGQPGSNIVDFFPFLKHLPPWSPGRWFAPRAVSAYPRERQMRDLPFDIVKDQMASGTAPASFLSAHLEALEKSGEVNEDDAEDLKGAAAVIWAAGADTTTTTIITFIFAMILYPEVQKCAQEEIDAVTGGDRLPNFGDRGELPYIECILQETLRWHPVAPLGLPHRSVEDDVYNGMFIPKGSILFANILSITHNEKIYVKPNQFRPERFLPKPEGNGEPKPSSAFGFGRRICPGRYMADAGVWIALVNILATLNVSKAIGDDGKEITPDEVFTSGGLTSRPEPFACTIRPRSRRVEELVSQTSE